MSKRPVCPVVVSDYDKRRQNACFTCVAERHDESGADTSNPVRRSTDAVVSAIVATNGATLRLPIERAAVEVLGTLKQGVACVGGALSLPCVGGPSLHFEIGNHELGDNVAFLL